MQSNPRNNYAKRHVGARVEGNGSVGALNRAGDREAQSGGSRGGNLVKVTSSRLPRRDRYARQMSAEALFLGGACIVRDRGFAADERCYVRG